MEDGVQRNYWGELFSLKMDGLDSLKIRKRIAWQEGREEQKGIVESKSDSKMGLGFMGIRSFPALHHHAYLSHLTSYPVLKIQFSMKWILCLFPMN